MQRIVRLFESYMTRRANYLVEQELMRMSDNHLKDMGITRGEIREVVWKHQR